MHYSEVNIKPIERISKIMRHNIAKCLKDAKRGKFLAIGFGWGDELRVAKEMGFTKISGVDIDKNAVRKVGKSFDVQLYNGKKLPYKSGSFDVVLMNAVLEHLRNPDEILSEIYRVLRKNGEVVIITPDPSQCYSIFSNFWADQTHVRPYHRIAVENMLKTNGFKIKKSYVRVAFVPIVQKVATSLGLHSLYYAVVWICNPLRIGIKEVCAIGVKGR
jgi:ubiquinone/menaquinone biosynthesis C-methylase UbiE